MTSADRIAVYQIVSGPSWPVVQRFFNELTDELSKSALKARGDAAREAIPIAQGAIDFVELLNKRASELQFQLSEPVIDKSALLPEETPLAIL